MVVDVIGVYPPMPTFESPGVTAWAFAFLSATSELHAINSAERRQALSTATTPAAPLSGPLLDSTVATPHRTFLLALSGLFRRDCDNEPLTVREDDCANVDWADLDLSTGCLLFGDLHLV